MATEYLPEILNIEIHPLYKSHVDNKFFVISSRSVGLRYRRVSCEWLIHSSIADVTDINSIYVYTLLSKLSEM